MKKHHAPLSCPRYDPRHYRFAMSNKVWEYHLKPVEFMIFSYLCYCNAHGQADRLTQDVVAEGVHLSVNTAKKYLAGLFDRGLITSEWSLTLNSNHINSEKFFTLPNEVFLLRLPSSAFMVYAYLLLIEDRQTHTCHPSYNTIATATGMSKNTAMKSISTLLEMELITVESSSYFDKRGMKWKGNNLYTILPVRSAVDAYHQLQLRQLELEAERKRVRRRQEGYARCHPRTALCASTVAQAAPDPSSVSA